MFRVSALLALSVGCRADPKPPTDASTPEALQPCTLVDSGPVVATADGQVIEGLYIRATDGPGISIEGHSSVVVRNVRIEHNNGPGIEIIDADDTRIEGVSIDNLSAPPSGPNPSDEPLNIDCFESARLVVTDVRLTRGASGIYLLECPDATLSFVEGHDFRGPFPRGQLVQWNNSDRGLLEDFSVENPIDTSWPEDNVNIYQSADVTVRRGLVDGNNSPSGVGVIFDGETGSGTVEDVDAVHMGNGCFSDIAGLDGVVFRRTRCRDNLCTDQGRGEPLSNALMWCGQEGHTEIRLEESTWFSACNPDNLVWPDESFAVIDLVEADFVPRDPIRVDLCWE